MIYNRFDHEQQLLKCWGIIEDLRDLGTIVGDAVMASADKDRLLNIIQGMTDLYDARFDVLFKQFESSIHAVPKN